MALSFSHVTLVGLGLMGGSLARGMKRLASPPEIHGISSDPDEVREALAAGVLDSGAGPEDPLPGGLGLLVYAVPLRTGLSLLESHAHRLRGSETVITDVTSLKVPLMDRARALGLAGRFVGSHPMVGGTRSGFAHSMDDLYRGASIWIIPGEAEEDRVELVEEAWEALGALPTRVTAEEHDRRMAWTSHLPQLTATALARTLGESGTAAGDLGPGGQDMTRLAGSSPEMWIDLLAYAPPDLLAGLSLLQEQLTRIRALLEERRLEEIRSLMGKTREWKEDR